MYELCLRLSLKQRGRIVVNSLSPMCSGIICNRRVKYMYGLRDRPVFHHKRCKHVYRMRRGLLFSSDGGYRLLHVRHGSVCRNDSDKLHSL